VGEDEPGNEPDPGLGAPGERALARISDPAPTPLPPRDSATMLEAHAPHGDIRTWKGFLVHIGAIVIGLLIAVGLEQSVEFLHHRHQRLQLEEQMRGVLEEDTQRAIPGDVRQLTALHGYLVDLQTAIVARRHGQSLPAVPDPNAERAGILVRFPSLAPYEAAKENGTIALLGTQRIGLYNRIALQRDLLLSVYEHWFEDLAAVDAFRKRFNYSDSVGLIGGVDLAALSPAELSEYQVLVGTLMSRVDWILRRLRLLGTLSQAILDGARDETDMIKAIQAAPSSPADTGVGSPAPR
jgi:hypothetical protein